MKHKTKINIKMGNEVQNPPLQQTPIMGSIKKSMHELRSYKCSLDNENFVYINATSRGSAKSRFWNEHLERDWPYTSILCSSNGMPHTSERFKENAKYRGIEFAYCGMCVNLKNVGNGVIVGHNSSANLDVLFTDGKYKGQTLNCHPHYQLTYFDKSGNVVRAF